MILLPFLLFLHSQFKQMNSLLYFIILFVYDLIMIVVIYLLYNLYFSSLLFLLYERRIIYFSMSYFYSSMISLYFAFFFI